MVDILIRGIDIPACGFCGWVEFSGDGKFRILDAREDEVAEEYEYIELPTHGDLIDKHYKYFPTPHRKELNDYMKGWNACLRSVMQQPIIIPASEEAQE